MRRRLRWPIRLRWRYYFVLATDGGLMASSTHDFIGGRVHTLQQIQSVQDHYILSLDRRAMVTNFQLLDARPVWVGWRTEEVPNT